MATDYADVRLHCRCSGALNSDPTSVGSWCGKVASGEDGVCTRCREDCLTVALHGHCRVITVDEVIGRDRNWGRT